MEITLSPIGASIYRWRFHNEDMVVTLSDEQEFNQTENYFGKTIGNDYIDTLPIAKMYLPEMEHHKLSDLAEHYGISSDGAHRALFDCHMNQQVFEKLAKEMENPSEAAKQIKKCPKCGGMMKLRNGKFGEFYGCSGYPDCRYTENT